MGKKTEWRCSKKLSTVQLCRGGKQHFYCPKIDFFLLNIIKVNNSRVIALGQGCAKAEAKQNQIELHAYVVLQTLLFVLVLHELCITFGFLLFFSILFLLNTRLLLTDRHFSWIHNCFDFGIASFKTRIVTRTI